ncbi:MAG: Acyl-CoA dehydrogenase, long-chain specific [uncultured Acidimicrobiales bacterium]|uniref:Acyl-CoA dehydrogenase, long-chain specific n=1 Tax=uncultured Acidimicrobiales bacterium TaxID=310071 RepID=A0A6J4IED7_9ACTN|nr:MAG: Acyl-CoA dehydrogenase, long-chain specific [uncultured Acidimicrobiales bacterium]
MADHAALISERLEQLLAETDESTDVRTFRGKQYDLGLGWVHFPEGYGGVGAPPKLQRIVEEGIAGASRRAHDPGRTFFGLTMAGPTIVTHGSEEARQRLLRPMFTGEDAWCQLFSEPGAGSDLAGLSCRAVRDGDEWVVTGQKVWNTLAHIADRGMLVARTDPQQPKHRGVTYFALDMHAPGVEVRPLRQITGEAEFNEVYMTEVRVPDADRIGDVGAGWGVAMTTLANERTTIGGGGSGARRQTGPVRYQWGKGAMAEALRIWHEEAPDPSPAMKDRLMRMMVESEVLYLTNVRAGQMRQAGNPGPEGSIAKLMFSEVNKRLYELCVDLLGPRATVDVDYSMRRTDAGGLVGAPGSSRKMFLRSRANSVEGGTSEVQRNILGERVLGLPGDVRVDKDRPWSEVPRS